MNQITEKPIDLSLHPKGINTVEKDTSVPDNSLRESVNFDISNDGKKSVRSGYTKVYSGSSINSLSPPDVEKIYFVEGGILKELLSDYTAISVATVSPDPRRTMNYVQIGDSVYYTNGLDTGVIKAGVPMSWSVATPDSAPIASIVNGAFDPGTYAMKYTALRNGEESGATQYSTVTLSAGSGLQLTNIPTHGEADTIRLYMTKPNGKVFYQVADITVGVSQWVLSPIYSNELEVDNLYPMPAGHCIDAFNGRLYVASNDKLVWSESLRYGLSHYQNYIKFPERISLIGAVNGGIYVVSDKTYFLSGKDANSFTQLAVYGSRAVEGTRYRLTHNFYNQDDYYGEGLYWTSVHGVVRGQNNGNVVPITEKTYAIDRYQIGASSFIEEDGLRKLVTSLRNKSGTSNLVAQDKMTATIIRANEVT